MGMQSPKQMAASQRRALTTMRARIQKMADDWDEVDMCMLYRLTDLLEHVDECLSEFETEANHG